jgi:threonine aldolase
MRNPTAFPPTTPDDQAVPLTRALDLHADLGRGPHEVLRELLDFCDPATLPDEPVTHLEQKMAELLGKPSAMFCPSGKTAQQIALRIHAETTGRWAFAAHPLDHFDGWEGRNYAVLHQLRMHAIGDRHELMTAEDIRQVGEPLAAVVWELPQRELGGILPTWADLNEQVGAARRKGARVHMDGARLWEAQTYYERPYHEIAALFDSVYVSLYKSLAGIRGAVLLGDDEFIGNARVWNRRLGGLLPEAWPFALAALRNLDLVLPRMPEFKAHAVQLAAAINADGLACTVPAVPQTTIFHIHLPIPRAQLERAGLAMRQKRGIQLFGRTLSQPNPRWSAFEVSVGENALAFSPGDLVQLVRDLMA